MCACVNRLLHPDVNKYLTQPADWPIQGNYLWQKAFSEKIYNNIYIPIKVQLFLENSTRGDNSENYY